MRLFAGLPLSPAAIDRLANLRLRLAEPRDGLRWSPPEQWHVTLKFFGEVDENGALTLVESLGQIRIRPVDMNLEALGIFPVKGILYTAVTRSETLEALQAKVQQVDTGSDMAPESHAFHPHITVARSRNRTGLKTLQRLSTPGLPAFGAGIRWQAERFFLYESVLEAAGARYRTVAEFGVL